MLSLLLVLFLSQWVFGQNACDGPTLTITSQGDAAQITDCPTFSGTIVISPQATGVISIDGPEVVTGDISGTGQVSSTGAGLTSLTSSSISSIGGTFSLSGIPLLSTLTFSSLNSTTGINFTALAALGQIGFADPIAATAITIVNLNSLTSVPNFGAPKSGPAPSIYLANNGALQSVNISVESVSSLTISSNGGALGFGVVASQLTQANNITIQNASTITLDKLTTITGSLDVEYNSITAFSLPALSSKTPISSSVVLSNNPKLTGLNITGLSSVGGSLLVAGNNALTAVDFPDLTTVNGDLKVGNNTVLSGIQFPVLGSVAGELQIDNNGGLGTIAFPGLKTLGGQIDFEGSFTNISLPSLNSATNPAGLKIVTSSPFNCAPLVAEGKAGTIYGGVTCQASNGTLDSNPSASTSSSSPTATTTNSGGSGTGSSTSATPSPSKTGAASPNVALSKEAVIGFGVGFSVLLFAFN